MHTEGNEVHVSEEEASGGSKEGVVRWVLIIGTLLAIGALSITWITGSVTSDEAVDNQTVEAREAAEQRGASTTATEAPTAAPTTREDQTVVKDGLPVVEN